MSNAKQNLVEFSNSDCAIGYLIRSFQQDFLTTITVLEVRFII